MRQRTIIVHWFVGVARVGKDRTLQRAANDSKLRATLGIKGETHVFDRSLRVDDGEIAWPLSDLIAFLKPDSVLVKWQHFHARQAYLSALQRTRADVEQRVILVERSDNAILTARKSGARPWEAGATEDALRIERAELDAHVAGMRSRGFPVFVFQNDAEHT